MVINQRFKDIIKYNVLNVAVAFGLFIVEMLIGVINGSLIISADSITELIECLSSVVAIIGIVITSKPADKKHPFGYGRIEYVTSIVISIVIFMTGIDMLGRAVSNLFDDTLSDHSIEVIVVLIVAFLCKLFMGHLLKKKGDELNSPILETIGSDTIIAAYLSAAAAVSVVISKAFSFDFEGIAGVILALVIIKEGVTFLMESLGHIIGKCFDKHMSKEIKHEIAQIDNVYGVHKLIIHNYGYDTYIGSVNVRVPENMSLTDGYKLSRKISEQIRNQYGVDLVVSLSVSQEMTEIDNEIYNKIIEVLRITKGANQFYEYYSELENSYVSFGVELEFGSDEKTAVDKIRDNMNKAFPDIFFDIEVNYGA